jgi:branched-chain amino acid transport system substrate-binding protein
MIRTGIAAATVLAFVAGPAAAQEKTAKIGFISTFSGPPAAIGNDMRNSFELGLDHLGRKLGGLPVEVIYEDDQLKPEVGVQKTQKLIESDKVDFVVGYIWSNVILASLKPLVDSKTMTVVTNAGASQLAGELCSPYVFSTSWNNDQTPQAMGLYMNQKGIKKAFLIGPNYAAGRDMLAGVRMTFQGRSPARKRPAGPTSSISPPSFKARAAQPDAILLLSRRRRRAVRHPIRAVRPQGPDPLYTVFTIDELSIPRLRTWRSGCPAPRNGSTIFPTRRTRNSSPTTWPSTRPGPRSTARRPMTRRH